MIKKLVAQARCRALLVTAGMLPLPLLAAGPVVVDEQAQQLDQQIQSLKQDVLDIDARGQGIEQGALYPAYSRVTVYVGIGVKGLLLDKVTVSIDDGTPVSYSYSDNEARSLQDRSKAGLHRLMRVNAAPGSHRLKADFSAHYFGAKPDAPPVTGHYEAFFIKEADAAELDLNVEGGGFRSDPQLRLIDWKASR